jgi:hypothetical protein
MDYYLTLEHWSAIVRTMKDEGDPYQTERLAKDILRVIRNARFRQALLFKQKRGEEYELFLEKLNTDYDPELVKQTLDNDEFWEACFSLR